MLADIQRDLSDRGGSHPKERFYSKLTGDIGRLLGEAVLEVMECGAVWSAAVDTWPDVKCPTRGVFWRRRGDDRVSWKAEDGGRFGQP